MPTLDGIKAALTDHLQGLIKNITLGATGGEASTRDSGAGNPQQVKPLLSKESMIEPCPFQRFLTQPKHQQTQSKKL